MTSSLRDEFARASLAGFVSSLRTGNTYNLEVVAKQAYEMADAMLQAREASHKSDKNSDLAEINLLREAIRRLADQDATLSVVGGNVIVEMDAALTPEERDALNEASCFYGGVEGDKRCQLIAAALRGLLARSATSTRGRDA